MGIGALAPTVGAGGRPRPSIRAVASASRALAARDSTKSPCTYTDRRDMTDPLCYGFSFGQNARFSGAGRCPVFANRGAGNADTSKSRSRIRYFQRIAQRYGAGGEGHGPCLRCLHRAQRGVRQRDLLGDPRMDRDGAQLVLHIGLGDHAVCVFLPDVQPVRADPARQRRQPAGVLQFLLVRDAVLRRRRHRHPVLRHCRADVLFRQHPALEISQQPVCRPGRPYGNERATRRRRNAGDLFPLGSPRLVALCDRRPVPGLFRLPQEIAVDPALLAVPDHRRPDLRSDRPCRRSSGRVRHGVRRRDLPGPRRDPDGGRAEFPVRHRSWHSHPDHPDRGDQRGGDPVGGFRRRQWHPHHFRVEYLAEYRAARVLPVRRAVQLADGLLHHERRRLSLELHSDGIPDLQ